MGGLKMLLAGPILRRAEPKRVCIWVATSTPVRPQAEVFDVTSGTSSGLQRIGRGGAESVQLGPSLFVHLVVVTPDDGDFPTNRLLGYDMELQEANGTGKRLRLGDLGLLRRDEGIVYGDLPLPTFFLADRNDIHVSSL
jgi:hypothetical protein